MAGRPFTGVKRVATQHAVAHGYRCPKCNGRGRVEGGRVRVHHNHGCELWTHIALHYPGLLRILEMYRQESYN